ncbi:MAG: VanZ family protein [Gammaproteobacteria bacterium]
MTVTERPRTVEWALLTYVVIVIGVLTLTPFRFDWNAPGAIAWFGDSGDAPANVLLFLPVGYFFQLAAGPGRRRPITLALLAGAALSASVECLQLFLPDRLTSFTDLLANAAGAALGAAVCQQLARRFRERAPRLAGLEHPLVTVMYLLLPLMWLTAADVDHRPERVWMLAPLGAVGALILGGLWQHQFAPVVRLTRPGVALMIGLWFLLGSFTALFSAPVTVAACFMLVSLIALARLYVFQAGNRSERRFEQLVLVTVWPCYLVYLSMLVPWPAALAQVSFDFVVGYPEAAFDRMAALRIGEQFAALSLLGYLVAESRGRHQGTAMRRTTSSAAWVVLAVLVVELAHGFLPAESASLARFVLGCIGGGFGFSLYAGQLSLVRLLGGRAAA